MDRRTLLIGGLGALVLACLVWLGFLAIGATTGDSDNSPDHPGGLHYLCGECNKVFVLTTKQLAKHHKANWGQPVPCPHCGSAQTRQGIRCEHCGNTFLPDRTAEKQTCPKCRKVVSGRKRSE